MNANTYKPKGDNYMPSLLKTYDELYISSFPYAFILILFLVLLTTCPPLYHQIVNNFSVFCNLFWTIRPLFGQILITCLKNSKAWLSTFSYRQNMRWGRRCWMYILYCTIPLVHFVFRISMPVISGTANLMECGFFL